MQRDTSHSTFSVLRQSQRDLRGNRAACDPSTLLLELEESGLMKAVLVYIVSSGQCSLYSKFQARLGLHNETVGVLLVCFCCLFVCLKKKAR